MGALDSERRKEYQRQWYEAHREEQRVYYRVYGRKRYQEQRDTLLEVAKLRQNTPEYRAKEQARRELPENRAKQRARSAAYRALRSGLLVCQPCEVCGSTEVQMHHEDYSQQLVVRWLCRSHHFHCHHKAVHVESQ